MVHKISVTIRAQIADPPHPNTSTHLKYSLKVLYFVETSGASICINMIIPPVNTLSVKLKKPYTKPLPSKIKVKLMPSSKFVYLGTILIWGTLPYSLFYVYFLLPMLYPINAAISVLLKISMAEDAPPIIMAIPYTSYV